MGSGVGGDLQLVYLKKCYLNKKGKRMLKNKVKK